MRFSRALHNVHVFATMVLLFQLAQLIFIINAEFKQICGSHSPPSPHNPHNFHLKSSVGFPIMASLGIKEHCLPTYFWCTIYHICHQCHPVSTLKAEFKCGDQYLGSKKKFSQKNSHNLHQHHPQFTLNAEVKYRVTNYGHLWRAGVGTEAAESPDGRRWNTSFSKNARLVFESTHLSIILIIIVVTFNIPNS